MVCFLLEFLGVSLLVRKWPANSGLMYTSPTGADTGFDLGGALFLSILLKKNVRQESTGDGAPLANPCIRP